MASPKGKEKALPDPPFEENGTATPRSSTPPDWNQSPTSSSWRSFPSFDQLSDKSNPFDSRRTSSSSQIEPEDDFQSTPHIRQTSEFQESATFIPYPMRSTSDSQADDPPVPPAFTRTFSAPLPTRVGFLRHPLSIPPRSTATATSFSALGDAACDRSPKSDVLATPMQALSMEFADTLQSAIQTLLHLSPPHLLDNAKEQYSGCTVQMPTTSLSALLSSMRSLNYLSANIQPLIEDAQLSAAEDGLLAAAALKRREDFDVGELLQSIADLLGGQAAQAGVDLVLFHGDVGIKHVSVNGDGEGLGYLLGHIIRQILLVAKPQDTLELGLQVIPQSPSMTPRVAKPLTAADADKQKQSNRPPSPGQTISLTSEGPLLCVFEVIHNIYESPESAATTPKAELNPFTRLVEQRQAATPKLDTILCRRLLQHQNARLKLDAQVSSPLADNIYKQAYELTVLLPRGKPLAEPARLTNEEEAARQPYSHMKLATEPTLDELSNFAESLRGKKVVLHASLSSVFARHLTSYLGAWGMDISHVPLEEQDHEPRPSVEMTNTLASLSLEESSTLADRFIIVDDNVEVLKKELLKLKAENSLILKPKLSKRPTLLGRTKSTPLVVRQTPPKPRSAVLIHFTSLSNYNQVRDIVSSYLGAPSSTLSGAFVYPEVMVIPKPVGPRRFLTALHTAVNQPIVDPYFSPIATSPKSPGGMYLNGSLRTPSFEYKDGFFGSIPEVPTEELLPPPTTSTTNNQKAKSPLGEYPPRTVTTPTNTVTTPADEYFSGAMSKSGSGSAVVMSSPDGRPFGMFFEPPRSSSNRSIRKNTSRKVSSQQDTDKKSSPSGSRRQSINDSRRSSQISDEIQLTKKEKRRNTKTLPLDDDNPVIAKGRNRSGTITKEGILKKSFVSSPTSLKEDDRPAIQKEKSFIAPKPNKKNPATLDDIQRIPGVLQAKKEKEDVVVPPINVLIVEDNPINQNILSMFLRKKKIKHSSAKDGLEAVEKWRTGGFHLILMDIQLPVMDGISATKEIRKLEKNNNIGVFPMTPASESYRSLTTPTQETLPTTPLKSSVIIVALTASSLQSDRVNALAAGCNDFLTKPVSLKWLEKKIVEWGCMQALIDFDGWRRWKSADPKDSASETKKGFQTGPQAAALSLANRLKINPDKKSTRQTSISSLNSTTSTLDSFPRPLDIRVQTATPPLITDSKDLSLSPNDQSEEEKEKAKHNLKEARNELKFEVGKDLPDPSVNQVRPSLITDFSGSGVQKAPSPAPDLESIEEGVTKNEFKEEKDLPALPK